MRHRTHRRARRVAVIGAVAVLLAATGLAACSSGGLKVGLAYAAGGPGDHGFNDEALAGLDRADKQLSGSIASVRALTARSDETSEDQFQRLSLLCRAGYDPVIAVGYAYAGADPAAGPLARAARECPETRFAIIDSDQVSAPNVADLVFADEQSAFLVGVAAGRKTRTGTVGLVGGCPSPPIQRFVAGYQAGVKAADAAATVNVDYLSDDPHRCDFTDVDAARAAATKLYNQGADIVFQVAGGAGIGVFEAADALGRDAIGVDADQYETVAPPLRHVILTSATKAVDTAVYDFIASVARGAFTPGVRRYDLADGGVGYATSGGRISDIASSLAVYRDEIVAGRIIVPITP